MKAIEYVEKTGGFSQNASQTIKRYYGDQERTADEWQTELNGKFASKAMPVQDSQAPQTKSKPTKNNINQV